MDGHEVAYANSPKSSNSPQSPLMVTGDFLSDWRTRYPGYTHLAQRSRVRVDVDGGLRPSRAGRPPRLQQRHRHVVTHGAHVVWECVRPRPQDGHGAELKQLTHCQHSGRYVCTSHVRNRLPNFGRPGAGYNLQIATNIMGERMYLNNNVKRSATPTSLWSDEAVFAVAEPVQRDVDAGGAVAVDVDGVHGLQKRQLRQRRRRLGRRQQRTWWPIGIIISRYLVIITGCPKHVPHLNLEYLKNYARDTEKIFTGYLHSTMCNPRPDGVFRVTRPDEGSPKDPLRIFKSNRRRVKIQTALERYRRGL